MKTIGIVSERHEDATARRVHEDLRRHGFDVEIVKGEPPAGVELIVAETAARNASEVWAFVKHVQERRPNTPVIVASTDVTTPIAAKAIEAGAVGVTPPDTLTQWLRNVEGVSGFDIVIIDRSKVTVGELKTFRRTAPNAPMFVALGTVTKESCVNAIRAGMLGVLPREVITSGLRNWQHRGRRMLTPDLNASVLPIGTVQDRQSGLVDAQRLASVLGISVHRLAKAVGVTSSAFSRRPTAPRAQARLRELAFIWGVLRRRLGSDDEVRSWLNAPHPRLDGHAPIELFDRGINHLGDFVRRAISGEPS